MDRADRHSLMLASCLAALAGLVDAMGYLTLKGFFVSFMSGNSTRLAVALTQGMPRTILIAGGLIGLFVLGVIVGELLRRPLRQRRGRLLGFVSLLLALAALAASLGSEPAAIALATLALGAENTVMQRAGPVSVAVTYMTGTLVRLGQGIAAAALGGARWGWLPYLLLWGSLAGGSVIGATLFPWARLQELWLAAGWCAALAVAAARQPELDREPN